MMNKVEALEVLSKIKSSLKKGKSTWYETASDEDKAKFDEWNSKKTEAIDYAINVIICEDKLLRLQENAHRFADFIDNVVSAGEE